MKKKSIVRNNNCEDKNWQELIIYGNINVIEEEKNMKKHSDCDKT